MKSNLLTLLTFIIATNLLGQIRDEPIRIVLIGTLHFEPSQVDLYVNKELDVLSNQRQGELEKIAESLLAFGTDRICIEFPKEHQSQMDSLYNAYRAGRYELAKDEIDQIALRSANLIGLESISCVNTEGIFYVDSVMEYATSHGQEQLVEEMAIFGNSFMEEADSVIASSTIQEALCYLNSDSMLMKNASFYTKYLSAIGTETTHIGSALVAEWYKTNIMIYTNILTSIQPSDEEVVIVFGQGHIPILRHLISNNPDFTLVELKQLLEK